MTSVPVGEASRPAPPLTVLGLFDKPVEGRGWVRGGAPQVPFGYGAQFLHGDGIELLRVEPVRHAWHRKVRDVVEHRAGVYVDLALRGAPAARHADVVFAYLEGQARFAATLRRRGVPPYAGRPLVVLACWWGEELLRGAQEDRRRILRDIDGIDRLVVLSSNQVRIFEEAGVAPGRVVAVPFNVDADYYSPDATVERDRDLVALGIDRGRDYDTLVAAARLLPGRTVDIVTHPERFAGVELPPNVRVHAPVEPAAYLHWLRRARLVVVPTVDLAYPTGQSVVLEAAATGACVAVTRTEAMSDYVEGGRTGEWLPLGDAPGVARVVEDLLRDDARREALGRAARERVVRDFAMPAMWTPIRAVLHEVMQEHRRS